MHSIATVDVLGSPMDVFLFTPQCPGPHSAVILAQHLPGGHAGLEDDEFTLDAAARIAAAGHVVAVPFLFHWWPRDEEMLAKARAFRDDWTAADLRATRDLLAARDDVDGDRLGIVGHCWGGRVAWLAACELADLRAMAIFYGGRVKLPMGPGATPLIDRTAEIRCPVIGFFGNEDTNPPPGDVDDYAAALDAAGVPHVFHRYDGAGHAFQNFPTPERYHAEASEDAWARLLAFLEEQLGS